MSTTVFYHGNCYDGFTAAWIARRHLGPGVATVPCFYGEDPPKVNEGDDIYVVDFSFSVDVTRSMIARSRSFTMLDHHETARDDMISLCSEYEGHASVAIQFDMERSGAGMAWDHFHPEQFRPEWIDCVEDRDLWRFRYAYTKSIHAFMASRPMTFEEWDAIHDADIVTLCEQGAAISSYIGTYCTKAAEESRVVDFEGHRVAAVNVPYQNASEMASVLLRMHPEADFCMGYFQRRDGRWQFSLRSRDAAAGELHDDRFHVGNFARRFGGGGHAGAAGFDLAELPEALR